MQLNWISISTILVSILSPVFIFLARSNSSLDVWQAQGVIPVTWNLVTIKDQILFFGVLAQTGMLAIPLLYFQSKYKKVQTQRAEIFRFMKDLLTATIAKTIGKQSIYMDIRIFVPKKGRFFSIREAYAELCGKQMIQEFSIKNILGLGKEDITKGISFEVSPIPRGVLGCCYHNCKVIMEDELKTNPERIRKLYNMTEQQMLGTCNLCFCICVPVMNNNNVVGIVAFDCEEPIVLSKLTMDKKNMITERVTAFSINLYQRFPDIFNNEKEGFKNGLCNEKSSQNYGGKEKDFVSRNG